MDRFSNYRFSSILFFYFTVSSLMIVILIGVSMNGRMRNQYNSSIREENKIIVDQTAQTIETYVQQVMKLSDSVYYDVIKNADLTTKETWEKVNLLYDSQKEIIDKVAVFSAAGEMVLAAPAARLQEQARPKEEDWYQNALKRTDIMHFSTPMVQNLFENNDNSYQWVVTFSRAVELLQGTTSSQGVLLMNLSYNSFAQLLQNVNLPNDGYLYLVDRNGEILYHPKNQLIASGIFQESPEIVNDRKDGSYQCMIEGEKKNYCVKTIGYTGWRVIGVSAESGFYQDNLKTSLFMIFMVSAFIALLAFINFIISSRLTKPLNELEESIHRIEAGELKTEIEVGGSYEIIHLGESIERMAGTIGKLMDDIVDEHEAKRKSEFDALQSQINPHFLYNTLDIIVWMIENEQKEEAVRVVTALGRFFRISLSRGRNIITVSDELEHVRNYLLIQKRRFKGKFNFEIDAPENVMKYASLKLMLQPLAENAVYHGMEYMDGDGLISLRVREEAEELIFEVEDNGLGMTQEMAESLLTGKAKITSSSRGSGIGVKNVNERIKIYFGNQYGIEIISEPDEGTNVRIHLPKVLYDSIKEEER